MGNWTSRAENQFVKDRVSLTDGLDSLYAPRVAAYGNGRYIFILGNKQVNVLPDHDIVGFNLDIVDLLLSKRHRIEHIGDFYDFGHLVGFYALNEREVVVIDYNEGQSTLRQRLILIRGGQAECPFHRCSAITMSTAWFLARTVATEEWAVTVSPNARDPLATPYGVLFPRDPTDGRPAVDITPLLAEANHHLRASFSTSGSPPSISSFDAPFFTGKTTLGFFTDAGRVISIDPKLVVIVNFKTRQIYVEETVPDAVTNFPLDAFSDNPFDCRGFQNTDRQMTLLATFPRSPFSWQCILAAFVAIAMRLSWRLFIMTASINCLAIGRHLLKLSVHLTELRFRIVRPPAARLGVLCTRTLRWKEQLGAALPSQYHRLHVGIFPDGQAALYEQRVEQKFSARRIGEVEPSSEGEEIRIVDNAWRPPSLKTLSSMAVAKESKKIDRRLLEIIAARI